MKWAIAETRLRSGQPATVTLSSPEAFVLLRLADYYNEDVGRAWPSQQRLSEETSLTVRTIIRAVAKLRTKKLVDTETWIMNDGARRMSLRYLLPQHRPDVRRARSGPVVVSSAFSEDAIPGDAMPVPNTNLYADVEFFER
jgi:hypothetical protein